jgi:hypothetical protein
MYEFVADQYLHPLNKEDDKFQPRNGHRYVDIWMHSVCAE